MSGPEATHLEETPPMAYVRAAQPELQTVVETPEFVDSVKRVLTEAERAALIDHLAAHPTAGNLIQGTGGARKLRWGAKGKGKSGGARAITFYAGPDVPVFLLAIFGKGDKANLSNAERNELRDLLARIAAAYRKGAG
jgi:hypothetical protein